MTTSRHDYESDFHYRRAAAFRAALVILMLESRDIPVSEGACLRIASCTDIERLEGWLYRTVKVSSVDDLFAE